MFSSDTVKIVVKLKDTYFLEEETYNSFINHVKVNETIFEGMKRIKDLYSVDNKEKNNAALSKLDGLLTELKEEFSEDFIVKSPFSEIDNNYVSNLMNAAFRTSGYRGENLLNCYIVETSKDKAQSVLETINVNKKIAGIDYAYIREELVEFDSFSPESRNKRESMTEELKSINDKVIVDIDTLFKSYGIDKPDGSGVTIVDVEQGWNFNNIGIRSLKFSEEIILGGGVNRTTKDKSDHGTKTLNVLFGVENPDNAATLNGLCAGAKAHVASVWLEKDQKLEENREAVLASILGKGVPTILRLGDIILLELQIEYGDKKELFPVEKESLVNSIIKFGVNAGFIIIEAAGNGNLNLNSQVIDMTNKNLGKGAGAIMVGALGKIGDNELDTLGTSNHGERVDCYCFGDDILTSAQMIFNSTSLATSIIAALATNLQKKAKSQNKIIDIDKMRLFLSSNAGQLPNRGADFIKFLNTTS